jgi:CRP-like cAMP-binding protein
VPKQRHWDYEAERSRLEEFWRDADRDAYVPLSVAAAVAIRVHGDLQRIVTQRDYSEALNVAAKALGSLVPVYTSIDSRSGRVGLVLDPVKQTFVYGATQLRSEDGTTISDLSVRRSDVVRAVPLITHLDLPGRDAAAPASALVSAEASHTPRSNRLLASLGAQVYQRVTSHMELVHLPLKKALYTPGTQMKHVYFPVSGLVSLLYIMRNGAPTQIAMVGNDGFLGVAAILGGGMAARWAIVQLAGYAYRLDSDALVDEFARGGATQAVLLRYMQAFMTQTSQTSLCNRHHTVEQQLCRWLLVSLDRVASGELSITQEQISDMLGVRRASVTAAARRLQAAGAIQYTRGHITVSKRGKLMEHVCECYEVVRREYERLAALSFG